MKSSNKLFIGFILILLLAPFWFVFLLSQELTDNQPKPGVFDPPSGEQKSYPMAIDSFQYIVADGVTVEFDTGKWQAILETSESLRSLYSIETRNDTLYLSKDPSAPYYGDWALAHVRAPRINGVTVVNGGEIRVEGIEPRFHSRDLTIRMGEGKIYLPVDTDALDLRYDGGGAVMLRGKASRLNVQGHQIAG